jgi:hypothetical protein
MAQYSGIWTLSQVGQAIKDQNWTGLPPPNVEYLVVAGGGAAGATNPGGGGGGGVLQGMHSIVPGTSYTVTVGGGGTGTSGASMPTSGSNSVFGGVTALGGGYGANNSNPGANGGSGGGGMYTSPPGAGTPGQGNTGGMGLVSWSSGGPSGGGGGAGTPGEHGYAYNVGGNGGNGIASFITGTKTGYGGGGAGSTGDTGVGKSMSVGGYGGGGDFVGGNGSPGTANTGGGGAVGPSYTGGNGGSGIVVVSYPDIYNAPVSTTGSPTVSTSGSGSMSFNGSSSYIGFGGQSNFAFGTGDFTIEMWFYAAGGSGTNTNLYDSTPSGGGVIAPQIYIIGSPWTIRWYGGSAGPLLDSNFTVSTSTWYHLAVTRSGTSTKIFVNGTQQGSTLTDSNNYTNGSNRPVIGTWGSGSGNWFNGNITNLRVIKGTALYTSNFTVPTVPLTAVTNTQLLMSAVSGAYVADTSPNQWSLGYGPQPTNVSWSSLSPFATGLGYKNRVYTWASSSGSITF